MSEISLQSVSDDLGKKNQNLLAEIFFITERTMSDQSVAAIARELSAATVARAKSRSPEDQKTFLLLLTQLVAETSAEKINIAPV